MSNLFEAPPLTTLGSLEAIVRNVGSAALEPDSHVRGRTIEVERVGDTVRWYQDGKCMFFPISSVASLEVAPFQNAGERFIAIVLAFVSGAELLRYRLITSHESEAAWLKKTAERIAQLLDMSASDLSQSHP